MKYIEGCDRAQMVLFPEMLDDLVSDDNPVKFIDEFVNQLDLVKLGFNNSRLVYVAPGAPCYSPKCLLKLYVYGYFKKIRSSRKLMEMCRINIEAMWLLERLTPDFRTISDFRKDNIKAIKKVLKAFVKVCIDLGLYSKEAGVQDGSKFRAVNSKDNNVTVSKLEKKLEIADKQIDKYIEEMEKNDKEECDAKRHTEEEMLEKIEELRARKEEYNNLLNEMKEEGVTQKSFVDPESRLMKTANGGFDVCYNVQIIVDPVSHLIGAVEVTNNCNDMGLLSQVAVDFKEEHGIGIMEVVADKGYEDKADMLECLMNGIIPHVSPKSREDSYEFELDYKAAEITDEMLDSTSPESIRTCLESGNLPNIYKDSGIEVSVNEIETFETSSDDARPCFTLNKEGTAVLCPTGSELKKVARLFNKGKTRFVNRAVCRKCTEKCTTSAFKQVDLKDDQTELYTKKLRKVRKVTIKLTLDKEKIANRKCVVEHPFGTIKRSQDGTYTLLSGKEKVGADLSLQCLAYNIKRVINMVGMLELIEKMRGMIEGTMFYFSRLLQSSMISHPISKSPILFS